MPNYQINITYVPQYQSTTPDGVTASGNYFVASMPELGVYATGATYGEALNAVLATASNATTGQLPYSSY